MRRRLRALDGGPTLLSAKGRLPNVFMTFCTLSLTFSISASLGLDSSIQSRSHARRFCSRRRLASRHAGKSFTSAATRGVTMNSMKPICEFGLLSLSRSLRNCTGTPSSFSRSPCSKNSSRQAHAKGWVTSQVLQGFDTSAECRMAFMANVFVSCSLKTSRDEMSSLAPCNWTDELSGRPSAGTDNLAVVSDSLSLTLRISKTSELIW
mmetsp:Transcript_117248/g.261978  ORF Transcript_117248/g.261978 Transcript_117248/m.261978 type:complete len:208 (-) Transcript_117248:329-952(-)